MDVIIKLDWENDGGNNLALFRLFELILFCFANEIGFLLHFLREPLILNRIIFSQRTIIPTVVGISLTAAKTSLVLDQECPVGLRKRFEFRRMSVGSRRVLFSFAGDR